MSIKNHNKVKYKITERLVESKEFYILFDDKKRGVHHHYYFENGYGASVIYNEFSYGLELAVLKRSPTGKGYSLCYDSPVSDDVLGYMTEAEVKETLEKIKKL